MNDKLILSPVTKEAVERLLAHVLEMVDSGGPAIETESTAALSLSSNAGQASTSDRVTEEPTQCKQ